MTIGRLHHSGEEAQQDRRRLAAKLFGRDSRLHQGMRLAIAESPDIDIYSMDDIIWSLTTRVNPHTDIINPLPAGSGKRFSAGTHDRGRKRMDCFQYPL